jgi:hypothetical protein
MRKKKMMQRRRNLLRVFTLTKACFIYKHILTGLHEIKAHNIFTRSYILHRVDDNEGKYISKKPREIIYQRKYGIPRLRLGGL